MDRLADRKARRHALEHASRNRQLHLWAAATAWLCLGPRLFVIGGRPPHNWHTSNNWSQAVGAIFFVGWAAFVGFMILRMAHMRSGRSARNPAYARAGSVAGGAPPFVRTAATKQASLEEVLAWPPQQQAEEFMARAVEHDSAARQAIERTHARLGRAHPVERQSTATRRPGTLLERSTRAPRGSRSGTHARRLVEDSEIR